MDNQPVGRDRVGILVEDATPGEYVLAGRGFSLDWQPGLIRFTNPGRKSEIGPGDGQRLVLQLSRSASWGERNWLGRLLKRPRPRKRWLNVRVRSMDGLQPVYLRAAAPRGVDLVGFPVLPGIAVDVPWDRLVGFLKVCHELEVQISSWSYDDTAKVEVQDDPLSDIKPLLEAPSSAHWSLLCHYYDGLSEEAAGRVLPKLLGELARWPDAIRQVEPDNDPIELSEMLRRTHSHLELSRVIHLMPQDQELQRLTDLGHLAVSPQSRELSRITIHATPKHMMESVLELLTSQHLNLITHVELRGFSMSAYQQSPELEKLLTSDNARRLVSLRLLNARLSVNACQKLNTAAHEGRLPRLTSLDLSHNTRLGDDGLRALLREGPWSQLQTLVLRDVNLTLKGALALLDDESLAHLEELRVGWLLGGREMLIVTGRSRPITQLDLYNRGLKRPDGRDILVDLLKVRRFASIRKLSLAANRVGDDVALVIARAHHLTALRSLDLSDNSITNTTLQALSQAPHLQGLRKLDLTHTHITAPEAPQIIEAWKQRNPELEIIVSGKIPDSRELKQLEGFTIDPNSSGGHL